MNDTAAEKLDTMQRIELASGAEVELHPAGPLVRASAWIIDGLWIVMLSIMLFVARLLLSLVIGAEAGTGAQLVVLFLLTWFYRVFFEVRRGATPGQKAKGLRVVMTSGAPITLPASLLRNVLRVADWLPFAYFTGLVSCLMTRRFQRLGDLVADTMVVYATPALSPASLIPEGAWNGAMPPPVPLSREERAAIVHYAERLPMWSASRREELAAHARELTGADGREGVLRLNAMGRWLRES